MNNLIIFKWSQITEYNLNIIMISLDLTHIYHIKHSVNILLFTFLLQHGSHLSRFYALHLLQIHSE